MADRQDEISTLNTLIATVIDSITGYEDAASNSEAGRFQQMFRERAGERQRVVEDLRAEVRRLGGNPEDDGSFMGKTHQRFLDLKSAITGRDEQAIVNEVERGEDYLKEKFETALNSDTLSGDSRSVVESAYQSVRSGHDQMSQLKHGMEADSLSHSEHLQHLILRRRDGSPAREPSPFFNNPSAQGPRDGCARPRGTCPSCGWCSSPLPAC
jgi:uncharacterized protein (TIGR02284 family)